VSLKSKSIILFTFFIFSTLIQISKVEASDTNSLRIIQEPSNNFSSFSFLTSGSKSLGDPDTDFKLCDSINSSECKINKQIESQWFGAYISLPFCKSKTSEWCISGLEQQINGKFIQLKFITYSSNNLISSQNNFLLPSGASTSLWKNEETNEFYTVNSRLSGRMSPYYENQFSFGDFSTLINKVEVIPDQRITSEMLTPRIEKNIIGISNLITGSAPSECVWVAVGECGKSSEMNLNSRLALVLNVGNKIGGWFDGRLSSPIISTKKLSEKQYQLRIEANPVSVPQYQAEIEIKKVPDSLKEFDSTTEFPGGKGNFANDSNFKLFDLWTSLVKNQSTKEENVWNFNSITNSNNLNCLTNNKQVLGIVTTNSTIYQGQAPELKNGSLIYQVGAPHFSSTGKVLQGYYYLSLRKDIAKCLYKFSTTPTSAKVQIQNIDGTSYLATSTLKESNGWLNLRVAGFTYSTPKILVSFPKKR